MLLTTKLKSGAWRVGDAGYTARVEAGYAIRSKHGIARVRLGMIGSRKVRTPTGTEWWIDRRWTIRRSPRWRKVLSRKGATRITEAAFTFPDSGDDDIALVVFIVGTIAVIAIVMIPLLLFGVELIILGLAGAAGIVGRTLLGRPWVIEAVPAEGDAQVLAWRVGGWRRSGRVIEEVAAALNDGRKPVPSDAVELVHIVVSP